MNIYEIENYKKLGLNTPYISEGPWSANSVFNNVDLMVSRRWTTDRDGRILITETTSAKVSHYTRQIISDEEMRDFEWAVLNSIVE